MSVELDDKARTLAARIAHGLTENRDDAPAATSADIAELRAGLRQVLQRLNQIETRLIPTNTATPAFTPIVPASASRSPDSAMSLHPSQERFNVGPVVSELVDYLENVKTCDFEPGHKPCDNCAMCSARGF